MSMTLSSMRTAVRTVFFSFFRSSSPSTMCAARFTEPRLHTATSSLEVFSVISVHRFDECTTPTCCCGERTLQESLKVIHGWPVSNSIDSILRHRSWARTRLNSVISPVRVSSSYSW
jgi:hypothetical protein